jgi:hypothetical protein
MEAVKNSLAKDKSYSTQTKGRARNFLVGGIEFFFIIIIIISKVG